MNDQEPADSAINRLSGEESGIRLREAAARQARESGKAGGGPQPVKIVVRVGAGKGLRDEAALTVEIPAEGLPGVAGAPDGRAGERLSPALPQLPDAGGGIADPASEPSDEGSGDRLSPPRWAETRDPKPETPATVIPARMLNEFVYCQRLFYYEFVEGVFVESVDTLRGDAIHQRVDAGNGALPKAKKKAKPADEEAAAPGAPATQTLLSAQTPEPGRETPDPVPKPSTDAEPEIIHSRSVQMGSERLGVVAKMDLVEVVADRDQTGSSRGDDVAGRPDDSRKEAGETQRADGKQSVPGSAAMLGARSPGVPKRAGRAKTKPDETPDLFSQNHGTSRGGDGSSPAPALRSDAGAGIASPQAELFGGGSGDRLSPPRLAPDARPQTRDASAPLTALEVCPVDYKAGAPREGAAANELWDTDRMQLGLQALILRDNGYICNAGVIYYRATKQRVRLAITPELEGWVLKNIADARRIITGPIPAPLVHSPKCARCSLAPVCLPDETRMLAQPPADAPPEAPRRLIAARDDTRALYLNTPGYRVGCKDEVLQVKDQDRVIEEVRMRDVSHVALFGNIQISTQAIQSLCELEVPVTYFSMGGWFYGITRGHALKNIFLRMEQFRLARDVQRCLALARQFIHGKIRNQRTLLMRNHREPPEAIIGKLKRASEDVLAAVSLEELLGMEGAAASQYFQQFNGMIKVEDDDLPGLETPKEGKEPAFNFNFTNRNRRPPADPVNAMLSLAYSLLAKDCTLAALAVGFDPYLGFYHQPRFGRPALALDLMEEMRPLVAESTVLSCINNRVITEKDFVRAGQAVNLSAPGRKRFFQTYEQRMCSLITHPLFDYKVSYRRALELQARLLAKTLTGEIAEYIPLMTR